MLSIQTYYDLLPDLKNTFLSFVPTITYFISVKFYKTFFHSAEKISNKKYIQSSSKNMIASTPANIFLSYPLFNYFSVIEGITLYNIAYGIFLIDTMEYFFHYFLHKSRFLYNFHNVHHKPVPIAPETSFTNHDTEIALTSPIILFVYVFSGLSFIEYIIVTALSFSATVSDHTITSRRKFHYIHHHVDKNKNLQQPFFTFWDHIFGTYHKESEFKIPFFP